MGYFNLFISTYVSMDNPCFDFQKIGGYIFQCFSLIFLRISKWIKKLKSQQKRGKKIKQTKQLMPNNAANSKKNLSINGNDFIKKLHRELRDQLNTDQIGRSKREHLICIKSKQSKCKQSSYLTTNQIKSKKPLSYIQLLVWKRSLDSLEQFLNSSCLYEQISDESVLNSSWINQLSYNLKHISKIIMKLFTVLLVLIVVHMSSASVERSAVGNNFAVTFSTVWDNGNNNHNAYKLDSLQAWSAGINDKNQWIQVSATGNQWWTAVTTQGRHAGDQLITRFRVATSKNGDQWSWVDGGREFIGNFDQETKIRNNFDKPVYGKHLRLYPTVWINHISMRFDAIYVTAN